MKAQFSWATSSQAISSQAIRSNLSCALSSEMPRIVKSEVETPFVAKETRNVSLKERILS